MFSGPYHQAGVVVIINRINYFVNDNQHLGTRVIINLGGGSFDLNVQNASIIFANNGSTTAWTSTRHYARTAGFGTRTILDDAYGITGSLTGTNRRNVSYDATIQSPLIKKYVLGCARHFVAGTIRVANSKKQAMLLDYDPIGTSARDNIVFVTIQRPQPHYLSQISYASAGRFSYCYKKRRRLPRAVLRSVYCPLGSPLFWRAFVETLAKCVDKQRLGPYRNFSPRCNENPRITYP